MVHKALRWLSAASSLAWVVACAAPVSPDAGDAVRRLSGHYSSSAALQDTYWKLVQLHGQTIADAAERQREAHLVLHTAQQRLAGSGGCNRLAGSYTLDGPLLSFGRTAATRMACAQGMAQEQALLDALAATARWRIDAQRLDLLDAQGASLARFEAVALR
jgi:heat shock protein HslJ